MKEEIAGIVLAGGRARRMGGGDKGLRQLGGRPLLAHVIDRLRPQVSRLALNANGDAGRFAAFALPVVPDLTDGAHGPLAGILAGMTWARSASPSLTHIATVASDTPFFPEDLVQRLSQAVRGDPQRIAVASCGGRLHPVFGLWPISLAGDLAGWLAATASYSVTRWVECRDAAHCDFAPIDAGARLIDPFFNINTPEELAEAEGILGDGPTATGP